MRIPLFCHLGLLLLATPAVASEPLGPLAAEVSDTGASIWARGPGEAMEVELESGAETRHASTRIGAGSDHVGQLRFEGLTPATAYHYRVRFAGETEPLEGRFRTAPKRDADLPVRLVFGGDVAGQNVCRDAVLGFPVFETVQGLAPDVFIGLGDMIYADSPCEAVGRYGNAQLPGDFPVATSLEDFRAHWRYARADPSLQRLLSSTAYTAVWDDHEIVNDFGRDLDPNLLLPGLQAFREYNPIHVDSGAPQQLYRSQRWGRHVELFVLDTRGHRDANAATDQKGQAAKSLLGPEQARWLRESLTASDATWKLVVSSVPLSIPTGSEAESRGRDGWADFATSTGYERGLAELLETLRAAGVRNLVVLTTDVHFATVLRYQPFSEHPDFRFLEVVTGPLNAGVLGDLALDTTFNPERLFYHAPRSPEDVKSFDEALGWFNFGVLDFGRAGTLTVSVRDARGKILFSLPLTPER